MKKGLLLAIIILVASINVKAEFFAGAGISRKSYTITVDKVNSDYNGALQPFVTLGYYWSKFRFHLDYYAETEIKNDKNSNDKVKFTEYNLLGDYCFAITKTFNLFAGLGVSALNAKAKTFDVFENSLGFLAEVGAIYTAKTVDYGLAIKSTFLGYKNKVNNIEYKGTGLALPEIFIAKRF